VIIDQSGLRSVRYARQSSQAMCIFEYVYFARPDSIIGGKTCHTVRKELGRALAREYPVEADIVMPVPDSGNSAALGFAEESGIPFEMGYIRNHYVGRTFISPSQIDRDIKVRVKLNVIPDVVRDKRVVIIDDSIIRGTTTFSRVAELKKAGAKEVHVRISCPPTRFPCFYGIDFPSQTQLIAARHTVEEIRAFLHADSLGYLSLEGMIAACGGRRGFCCACYTGEYPVQIDEPVHKAMMERVRGGHSDDAPAAVKATMEAEQANGGNGEREAAARADQGEQAPADVPECAPDAPGASGSAATDDLFTLE
jgi:amidophosphoribosyltransferase